MTKEESMRIKDLTYITRVYCSEEKLYSKKYNEFLYFYLLSKSHIIKVNNNNVMEINYNEKLIKDIITDVKKIKQRRTITDGIKKMHDLEIVSDLDDKIRIFKNGNQYFSVPNYIIKYMCENYTNRYIIKIFLYLGWKYKIYNENTGNKNQFNFSIKELITDALGFTETRHKQVYKTVTEALEILKEDGFISYEKIRVNIKDINGKNLCVVEKNKLTKFNPYVKDKLDLYVTKEELKAYEACKTCEEPCRICEQPLQNL